MRVSRLLRDMSGSTTTSRTKPQMMKTSSSSEQTDLATSDKGTFHFCETCPKETNCCTRLKRSGSIEPPFLFERERYRIRSNWSDRYLSSYGSLEHGKIWTLQSREPGCIFYKEGRCAIYMERPFDCRLFPFDIRINGQEQLIWVVYTKLCPVTFDYKAYFNSAKTLLDNLAPSHEELIKFALHGTAAMYKQEVIELEVVKLPSGTSRSQRR